MFNKNYPILDLSAGLDEVGRGALAGDVVASAVILDKSNFIPGLKDSKRLTHNQRVKLSKEIKKKAKNWSIGVAHAREIDLLNISQATLLAMNRAILNLKIVPNYIFVDGTYKLDISISSLSVIKGDNIIPSISAASIIAKVYRDDNMLSLHKIFPVYKFNENKGYPTYYHLKMLNTYGITHYHRYSFFPVAKALNNKIITKYNI